MCFRVKMFRLESYLLAYIFYTWSAWTLISTAVTCTNLTLHCTNSIILTSPNYPVLYPNGESNEWYITAPPNRRILVTFNNFTLENYVDSIFIWDMHHDKKPYTGENMRFPPYLTLAHTLHIKFTSSESGRRKGFNISVSCNELSNIFSGRLMDGASPAEGYLELPAQSGEWKRVCEDSLTDRVAEVICGELGYPGFKEISYENSTCASDHLKDDCTRAPTCNPNTYRLVDCIAGHSMCSSEKVVKIKCHEPGYKGCYELHTMTEQNGFTFSSTARCISSCKTHEIQAIAIMNHVECFCSTSAEVHLVDAQKCSKETTSLSKMAVYDASVGFCEELNDTNGGLWDSNVTWFGSIVHLTCMEGYSLKGSETLQCVPGSSPLNPVWNDSKPDCIVDDDRMGKTGSVILGLSIAACLVITIVLVLIIGRLIYRKHREKGKFGQRQEQTDTLSTPTHNRGRAVSSNSTRSPDGLTTPPRHNTNDSSTLLSVISSAFTRQYTRRIPTNRDSSCPNFLTPFYRSPSSFLHRNNPRSENNYVSSTSVPNTYYYASTFNNPRSGDTVGLKKHIKNRPLWKLLITRTKVRPTMKMSMYTTMPLVLNFRWLLVLVRQVVKKHIKSLQLRTWLSMPTSDDQQQSKASIED